ncbi:Glutathione S-transferase TCHQD [Hibiscus syriacus]|uniref:Glutathione S-transferase TCHQD n=1 Tax=Hibiscus syriacus TaxID=106335 RepID=A0A6A3CMB4_HIBSY|nr:Glutathione S-transferase TCHQD [Hibiscus syriacus]
MAESPDFASAYNCKLREAYETEEKLEDPDVVKRSKESLVQLLDEVETNLNDTTYIGGDEFTMADATFIPVLAWLVLLGLEDEYISCRPNIADYWSLILYAARRAQESQCDFQSSQQVLVSQHPYEWDIPDDLQTVLPLAMDRRLPGRPKSHDRIPSKGEEKKRSTCSQCKENDHTRLTCGSPVPSQSSFPLPKYGSSSKSKAHMVSSKRQSKSQSSSKSQSQPASPFGTVNLGDF